MKHSNSISFLNFFKIPPKKKTKKPKRTNSTKNLVHADLSLPDDDVINDDYESPDISVNDDSRHNDATSVKIWTSTSTATSTSTQLNAADTSTTFVQTTAIVHSTPPV